MLVRNVSAVAKGSCHQRWLPAPLPAQNWSNWSKMILSFKFHPPLSGMLRILWNNNNRHFLCTASAKRGLVWKSQTCCACSWIQSDWIIHSFTFPRLGRYYFTLSYFVSSQKLSKLDLKLLHEFITKHSSKLIMNEYKFIMLTKVKFPQFYPGRNK